MARRSTVLRRYLESLTLASGSLAGQPMRVFPWERKLLALLDSERGEYAVSVARGNGKSAVAGGIAAAYVDPVTELSPQGSEIIIVAASMSQGRMVFNDSLEFLRQRYDLDDKKLWRVNDSANKCEVRHLPTNVKLLALGNDPKKMHGRRPVLQIADELAQWDAGKIDAMLAAMKTASGKVNCHTLYIGTAPLKGSGHPFEVELNKPTAIVYRAEPEDDIFKVSTWHKANPSMRYIPTLRAAIEEDAEDAKADAAAEARFRALRLNQGGSGVVADSLLEPGTWERVEARSGHRDGKPVIAIDLATTQMAGAAAVWPSGQCDAFAAFPALPSLAERGRRDNVGNLYDAFARRKELIESGKRVLDIAGVLDELLLRWGTPSALVVDRHRETELREALEEALFPQIPLVCRGMGFIDGSADVRAFHRSIGRGWLAADKSLLLRHCIGVTLLQTDPAGNQKIKRHGPKVKDDAAVALVLAAAEAYRRRGKTESKALGSALV